MIQILLLKNQLVLIARIEEVSTELGEPDCKLIEPYELKQENGENLLTSWPSFTSQKELMIKTYQQITTKKKILLKEFIKKLKEKTTRIK